MEYKEFAKYYDKFYSKKNYKKEVDFLKFPLEIWFLFVLSLAVFV